MNLLHDQPTQLTENPFAPEELDLGSLFTAAAEQREKKAYEVWTLSGSHITQPHPASRACYRIGICTRGWVEVEIGLAFHRMGAETVHFAVPGQYYVVKAASADCQVTYLHFCPDFIDEVMPETQLFRRFPFLNLQGSYYWSITGSTLHQIQNQLVAITEEQQCPRCDSQLFIGINILGMLVAAKRNYTEPSTAAHLTHEYVTLAQKYKKLVAKHFLEHRSVAFYAGLLHTSSGNLAKAVKQAVGVSPRHIIYDRLITEAKALLRYSDLAVSEIAYKLDFTDPSHFAKLFRAYMGISPGQYRQGALN